MDIICRCHKTGFDLTAMKVYKKKLFTVYYQVKNKDYNSHRIKHTRNILLYFSLVNQKTIWTDLLY